MRTLTLSARACTSVDPFDETEFTRLRRFLAEQIRNEIPPRTRSRITEEATRSRQTAAVA